jgi:hypothetical protein
MHTIVYTLQAEGLCCLPLKAIGRVSFQCFVYTFSAFLSWYLLSWLDYFVFNARDTMRLMIMDTMIVLKATSMRFLIYSDRIYLCLCVCSGSKH